MAATYQTSYEEWQENIKINLNSNLMRNFVLLLCLATQLHSQTYKGKWLFENTFGNVRSNEAEWKEKYLSSTYTFNDKLFSLSVDLNTAYFVKKNIAVGTGLYSDYSKVSSNGYSEQGNKIAEGHYTDLTFLAVPFIRYYVHPNSKSSLYIQGGAGGGGNLIHVNESTNYYETGLIYTKYANRFIDHRIVTAQALAGLNYFFNEYVAFNTAVGFNYTTIEYTDEVTSDYPLVTNSASRQFNFTSTQKIISWRIGFTFFVGKKKEAAEKKG